MKQFRDFSRISKPTAIISVLDFISPTITEELVLRTSNSLAEEKSAKHVSIVFSNLISETEISKQFLEQFCSNIHFITELSEYHKIISKYKVLDIVCETAMSEIHPTVAIPSQTIQTIKLVESGNIEQFKKITPSSIRESDSIYLFNRLRKANHLEVITEKIELEKSHSRTEFFDGKYQIGQFVESKNHVYEILDIGTNYVVLVNESGDIHKCWPNEITESEQTIDRNLNVEFHYKGYIPKHYNTLSEATMAEISNMVQAEKDPYLILSTIKLIDNYCDNQNQFLCDKIEQNMQKLLPEEMVRADYKTDKNGKKYPAGRITFKDGNKKQDQDDEKEIKEQNMVKDKDSDDNFASGIMNAEDIKNLVKRLKQVNPGESMPHSSHGHRHAKVKYAHESFNPDDEFEFNEKDIDHIVNNMEDWHDIIDAYDDDELHLIDSDTGEHIEESLDEEVLNEVLSRVERIRAKIRFAKTKAKRERKIQLALKKRSTSAVINSRARKLAIKTLKMRIAKKPLDKLSVPEKERLERFIEKRRDIVNRIAMKMVPKIRKIENERLAAK